jgi:hypothetical protein
MANIINEIFDKIYIINLKKDFIKKRSIEKKLNILNIKHSFFEAIDGKKSPYKEIYENYVNKPIKFKGCHPLEKRLNKKVLGSYGSLGILKTMEKIFEDARKNKYKKILTFQDDIIFDNEFNSKFENYIKNIPDDWKILSFGVSQHIWSNVELSVNKFFYKTPYHTDGAFAIGFDCTIFKRMLNEIRKFNCNFDSGPIRNIYKGYPHNCYTLYPNLIIARLSNSRTQNDRNIEEYAKKFKWILSNFNYDEYSKELFISQKFNKFVEFWTDISENIQDVEINKVILNIINNYEFINKEKLIIIILKGAINYLIPNSLDNFEEIKKKKNIINIYLEGLTYLL